MRLNHGRRTTLISSLAETGMPDVLPPGFGEADKICQSFYDEVALGKRSSKEAMADARKGMQGVLDEYLS